MGRPTTPEACRERAEEYRTTADALESLLNEVLNNPIGETPLSKHFHVARTSPTHYYNSVSVFVDVGDDGSLSMTEPTRLQQGEHFNQETRNRHDANVSCGIQPFMSTDVYRGWIRPRLKDTIRSARANAHEYEQTADAMEQRQSSEGAA